MTRCDARIRREESRSVGARSHLLRTLSPSLYITWNLQLRVYRLFGRYGQPRQASHRFERSSLVAGRPKPKCHILWHRKSSICKQMQPSFWIYKLPRHLCYDQAKFHEIAYSFLHHRFFFQLSQLHRVVKTNLQMWNWKRLQVQAVTARRQLQWCPQVLESWHCKLKSIIGGVVLRWLGEGEQGFSQVAVNIRPRYVWKQSSWAPSLENKATYSL